MANPTDNLPGFAVQGLPSTINPIPQVQPVPRLAPQVPVQPAPVVPASSFVPRGPTPYGVPVAAMPAQPVAQAPAQAVAQAPARTAPQAPAQTTAQATPGATPAAPLAPAATPGVAPTYVPVQTAQLPTFGSAAGGEGQVGPFRDPSAAINAGFQSQRAYGDHFLNQAIDYISGGKDIFEQATRGRAIGNILHAVAGQNNAGAVQGQGADALNNSIAGLSGAALGAQASQYGAGLGYNANADRVAGQTYAVNTDLRGRTVQTGQTSAVDGNGIYTTYSNFAQPQVGPGGMVDLKPIVPTPRQATAPKLIENATSTDTVTGRPIKVTNGQWQFIGAAK